MTRKDYRLIAGALRAAKPNTSQVPGPVGSAALDTWEIAVEVICGALEGDNDAFDADKFYEACGHCPA